MLILDTLASDPFFSIPGISDFLIDSCIQLVETPTPQREAGGISRYHDGTKKPHLVKDAILSVMASYLFLGLAFALVRG